MITSQITASWNPITCQSREDGSDIPAMFDLNSIVKNTSAIHLLTKLQYALSAKFMTGFDKAQDIRLDK